MVLILSLLMGRRGRWLSLSRRSEVAGAYGWFDSAHRLSVGVKRSHAGAKGKIRLCPHVAGRPASVWTAPSSSVLFFYQVQFAFPG